MTRTMHISVKNSLGQWHGKDTELEEHQITELRAALGKIVDSNWLEIEAENGFVYFPRDIVRQSVIELREAK